MSQSKLDANQVIKSVYDATDEALKISNISGLVPESYDEIVLSYSGSDLSTVIYKKATVTIATLTLSYTLGNLTSVVRS
jgi:diketogulonate reductase-like aldo/keto reductase